MLGEGLMGHVRRWPGMDMRGETEWVEREGTVGRASRLRER